MKSLASLGVVWMLTGLGAVAGSIPGSAAGKPRLFAGAVVGGGVLAYLSPLVCSRLGWIARDARRAVSAGALVGFLLAAPTAATNLRTPVIPVLVCLGLEPLERGVDGVDRHVPAGASVNLLSDRGAVRGVLRFETRHAEKDELLEIAQSRLMFKPHCG